MKNHLSVCKFALLLLLLPSLTAQGNDRDLKAIYRKLFDAEGGFGVIENVDFSTARAINSAAKEKLLTYRIEDSLKLIISDYGGFICVILYDETGGHLLDMGGFVKQSRILYLDSKTFTPLAREEAWEKEYRALKRCAEKKTKWSRGVGADGEEEPLVPITKIIDSLDVATMISNAMDDWDKQTHKENESSLYLVVTDHDDYCCISFIDSKSFDHEGIPNRSVHHSYIDSQTYCVIAREDAKRLNKKEKENGVVGAEMKVTENAECGRSEN